MRNQDMLHYFKRKINYGGVNDHKYNSNDIMNDADSILHTLTDMQKEGYNREPKKMHFMELLLDSITSVKTPTIRSIYNKAALSQDKLMGYSKSSNFLDNNKNLHINAGRSKIILASKFGKQSSLFSPHSVYPEEIRRSLRSKEPTNYAYRSDSHTKQPVVWIDCKFRSSILNLR
jgi:hypothetical protein